MLTTFPFFAQLDAMDCGPTCLKMISKWYGKFIPLTTLREQCHITREGVSLQGISSAAEVLGYRTLAAQLSYETQKDRPGIVDFPLPCIVHWQQSHFIVVYKINAKYVWVADPAKGKLKLKRTFFEQNWRQDRQKGIVLGLEPTPSFYESSNEQTTIYIWRNLFSYIKPYKKLVIQFILGMFAGLVFQLIFPFLTQSLIDIGVQQQNISFVWLVLIAQLVLSISQASVQFIQSWIILNIGRRINVNLVNDFLMKMMRLPLGFFDSKNLGDLYQRIYDNQRVESFLTNSVLDMVFSLMSLLVFSVILALYNWAIFGVFFFFSSLYLIWVLFFMRWRKELDYMTFNQAADNQQQLHEMINGMQEIKLQGSEQKRRWKWVNVQAKLFHIQTKSLRLRQIQEFGVLLSSRVKDVLISFLAAKAVIDGSITLGMMMAIQYVVGQLDGPFQKIIQFSYKVQDAKISLERMGEVMNETEENSSKKAVLLPKTTLSDIVIKNLSFAYNPLEPAVLKQINLVIPQGKVTAIVGASGSGKTTLLKLLLGFYQATEGNLTVNHLSMATLDKNAWRKLCGSVMQDGYIFSDTIANNIAESATYVDYNRLEYALKIANIHDYVHQLPLSYHTLIGAKGSGLSQGQKQRILIARAVYKNPEIIFFDEATNALDATNEMQIMENLNEFFQQKTVVVVAHRLSTVKNADQIVVLQQGQIVEQGKHEVLIQKKGYYFRLVQNQLDLERLNKS